ncbi:MAG: OsmC family protein [Sphaerochaetaceae bacterium]|jgi:ribosomal protein S12 methylthiotransferase accessory factor
MSTELETMKVNFLGRRQVSVEYRGQTILTDQPKGVGGDGEAPTGFDLFIASLAACSGFYVQLFCQKRNIPLEAVKMEMTPIFNDETDVLSNLNIKVETNGDFPEKYKKTIFNLIDQCAVKKQLLTPPQVNIEIGEMAN